MKETLLGRALRDILANGVPAELLSGEVDVQQDEAETHLPYCTRAPRGSVPARMTLGELITAVTCSCSEMLLMNQAIGTEEERTRRLGREVNSRRHIEELLQWIGGKKEWPQAVMSIAWQAVDHQGRLHRELIAPDGGANVNPIILRGLRRTNNRLRNSIEILLEEDLPESVLDFLDRILSDLTGLREELEASLGPGRERFLLREVARQSLPRNWEGPAPRIDRTLVLVGTYPPRAYDELCEEFLDLGEVRRDTLVVAAYIAQGAAHYLLREMGEDHEGVLVQIVPVKSREEAETAARLWDPEGTGPLSDLHAAVEAARNL